MKNRNSVYSDRLVSVMFFLFALSAFLVSGCIQPLGKIEAPSEGMGRLSVFIISSEDSGSQAGSGPARTMLAADPLFTRYELKITGGSGEPVPYSSQTALFQIELPAGDYTITAAGFSGDKPTAQTWDFAEKSPASKLVTISAAATASETLTLAPYDDAEIYGTLQYSLNWDAVGQIPSQAELLIEQYSDNGTPEDTDDTWNPIPVSLMNESITVGSQRGAILLLQRATGLIKQTGSLDLPPGEYRLTTTVTMDNPYPPVSRVDIAHIFSNLTTPAAFIYGSGDLIVTNPGTDTGSGFITRFNFSQTPNAVSIIGSNPGPDGTRLIMVMVPSAADLTQLTPVVECAPGARVTSPAPSYDPDPNAKPHWAIGDYSNPTSWTAEGRNGVTQQYTVVVTKTADSDCRITNIAFQEIGEVSAPDIDQDAGSITVTVPYGTRAANPNYKLTPVISYIGTKVMLADIDDADNQEEDSSLPDGSFEFVDDLGSTVIFRVYAGNGATKKYTVMILEAQSGEADITGFFFDGYPGRPGVITPADGTIKVTLPYGTSLANLNPQITYKGNLSPATGVEQNFSVPVVYTATAWDKSVTKPYTVTVDTDPADRDTGVFDFVITNVPKAKVVIGTKPRADGKIPIVVQTPYATSPLIDPTPEDGPKTDLQKLEYKITLSDEVSSSYAWVGTPTPPYIPFGNQNDYQEAVFTVTAQAGNTQDYVVVVARDVQYYYVKATGKDDDPDQYNGGSESTPFKTLAYAVYQAVKHNVDHIYIIGTLNDTTEGGAWEDTSTTEAGNEGTFRPSGASNTGGGAGVFNLKGTGKNGYRIYITGVGSNAVLQGTSGKRVISITGGARITFENITIRDGGGASYTGNGGGIYAGEGSHVVWKSGSITGNRAFSGGGVYIDNSEFDMMSGSVSGNTAAGSAVTRSHFENNTISDTSIAGGGGVYVFGEDSLLWFSDGEISNNSTSGSGGGVLVNASAVPESPTQDTMPHNFIMSAGAVNSNTATGGVWPHGGGGVFVAKGSFEMFSGHIMNNSANRQGGGVFVWSRALFYMDGDASITGNKGVGSAKAICNRGITTMRGNAQADSVYIWNYSQGSWNNGVGDQFTMMEGARTTGMVLAFADDPQDNRNYVNIVESDRFSPAFFTGTDRITTIDLESRLNASGNFSTTATIDSDWLGNYLIKNGGNEIPAAQAADLIKRFPLGSFTSGNPSRSLSGYKLDNTGKLLAK